MNPTSITIALPGKRPMVLSDLLLDFTGTLSRDGRLLPGVAGRLRRLARQLRVSVLTADTFGTAGQALRRLPVEVRIIRTGADKARIVRQIGAARVAAIGNGRNDVAMFKAAALSIAIVGPEGVGSSAMAAADVVSRDINDALDLLLNPLRLKATLRE